MKLEIKKKKRKLTVFTQVQLIPVTSMQMISSIYLNINQLENPMTSPKIKGCNLLLGRVKLTNITKSTY